MTASVASFLTQAQKKGAELPPALSGALLLAAARLSEAQSQAVRPYQLLVDDDGALELLAGDVPTTDGYAAAELRNGAVLPDDSRVLVFAVGALGYELITLAAPREGEEAAGPEVKGPLAPVIRKAMAERQHRFRSLREMIKAIEGIQGRVSREEERLILAAVAASTPLPPSQKLAKLELEKAAAPESVAPRNVEKAEKPPPVFTQVWDPLEATSPSPAPAAPAQQERAPEPPRPSEEERAERLKVAAALESGRRDVAELGARVSILEEQMKDQMTEQPRVPVPEPSGPAALTRDVKQMLERRAFAEAERALHDPLVANDATLQLLLGQAVAGAAGTDPARLERAAAAFRRAGELDAQWAQPRALLGAILLRQGKRAQARACSEAALQIDPGCPEALAALATFRSPAPALAASAAAGAVAVAALLVAFRPSAPLPRPEPRIAAASAASEPPAPKPAPSSLPPAATVAAAPAPAAPVQQTTVSAVPPPPAQAEAARTQAPAHVQAPAVALRLPQHRREADRERAAAKASRVEAKPHRSSSSTSEALAEAAKGDKALRSFDTKSAEAAFSSALKLDPSLPSAHRGMGMVYVLLGKNAEAKAEYTRYLQLAPDAPDREQIARVLSR